MRHSARVRVRVRVGVSVYAAGDGREEEAEAGREDTPHTQGRRNGQEDGGPETARGEDTRACAVDRDRQPNLGVATSRRPLPLRAETATTPLKTCGVGGVEGVDS